MGINEGGMVNGAMSRKVEITLNSAVSLVQTLQPLLFIPCYKSGGGWSGKCSETGEVTISLCGMKSSNHRHLLITFCVFMSGGHSTNLIINRKLSARLHKHTVRRSYYDEKFSKNTRASTSVFSRLHIGNRS